jgi:hypothetical protein
MKSYLDQSSPFSYSLPTNEMTEDVENLNTQVNTSQKKGLADVFSKDTMELPNSTQTEQVEAKKTSELGLLSWFLSFFTSYEHESAGKKTADRMDSLKPAVNKIDTSDQDHLQKVIRQLNAVNQKIKEFDEESNLDKQFMEIHIALAELKEELAKTVTGDIHRTHKANAEKKKDSQKKLDDLVEAGRKRAWTNMIQSGLSYVALTLSAASVLGVPGVNIVANPIFVVSQLLATVTSEYYKIKHNTLNSTNIVERADIQRNHKKIEALLGELKIMTDSVNQTQKLTGSLLKNHHTAVTSILQH